MIENTIRNIHLFLYIVLLVSCSTKASKQTYFAQVFDNNEHLMDYHVKSGRIYKEVYFDNARKAKQEIIYDYDEFGELNKVNILGDSSISGMDSDLVVKLFNDAIVQKKYLDNLKVNIPLLPITTSELNDISYLLSTAETIRNTSSGKLRVLAVDTIGKTYRFSTSNLERFISASDIVEKYTIELKDGIVVKEEIVFEGGQLVRTYFWKNLNEFNISIEFRGKKNEQYFAMKKIIINEEK
jgi:hypothetical protein